MPCKFFAHAISIKHHNHVKPGSPLKTIHAFIAAAVFAISTGASATLAVVGTGASVPRPAAPANLKCKKGVTLAFIEVNKATAVGIHLKAVDKKGALVAEMDVDKVGAADYAKMIQGTWQCLTDEGEN